MSIDCGVINDTSSSEYVMAYASFFDQGLKGVLLLAQAGQVLVLFAAGLIQHEVDADAKTWMRALVDLSQR